MKGGGQELELWELAGPSRGWGSCGLQHDAVVCVGWLDHDGLSLAQEINRENVERWSQIR